MIFSVFNADTRATDCPHKLTSCYFLEEGHLHISMSISLEIEASHNELAYRQCSQEAMTAVARIAFIR